MLPYFRKAVAFTMFMLLSACGVNLDKEAARLCGVFDESQYKNMTEAEKTKKILKRLDFSFPDEIEIIVVDAYRAPPAQRYGHVVKKIGDLIHKPYQCEAMKAYFKSRDLPNSHSAGF